MKKILLFTALLVLAILPQGCKKYVEGYDKSPNDPIDVNMDVLLTGTELATFSNFTGNLSRVPGIFVDQFTGRQFQFETFQQYVITEADLDNEYQQLYTGGMLNAQKLIEKAGDANPYYRGIGRILRSMTIGLTTDLWGDVPNSAALKGLEASAEAFNPVYDTQENILRDIQATLDAAIQDLSAAPEDNLFAPGFDDIIFGGDPQKWRNAARVLKARYYNHLSKRDPMGSAEDALAALDAAYADGLDGADDDMMAYFGTAANEWNQWYAFEQQRAGYITISQFFIDLLAGDPRLPLYASGTADDPIGPYYGSQNSSLPLVTYFEAKFIEAEAALRAGNAPRAATAFNEAVTANLTKLGVPNPAYLMANANETAATITLEKIMTQKYIAMFTQPEVWADWRRTGFPVLTPNPDGVIPAIPRRFPTMQNERLYNTNAIVISDMLMPVWWDQ